jgi:hypothetical protein
MSEKVRGSRPEKGTSPEAPRRSLCVQAFDSSIVTAPSVVGLTQWVVISDFDVTWKTGVRLGWLDAIKTQRNWKGIDVQSIKRLQMKDWATWTDGVRRACVLVKLTAKVGYDREAASVSIVNPSNKQRRKFFINYLTEKEAKKLYHGEVHTIAFVNGVEGSVTETALYLARLKEYFKGLGVACSLSMFHTTIPIVRGDKTCNRLLPVVRVIGKGTVRSDSVLNKLGLDSERTWKTLSLGVCLVELSINLKDFTDSNRESMLTSPRVVFKVSGPSKDQSANMVRAVVASGYEKADIDNVVTSLDFSDKKKLIHWITLKNDAAKSLDMELLSKITGVKKLNVMRTDETPAVQFYRGILNASSIKLDNTQKQKLDPSYDCEKLMSQLTEIELDRAELVHTIVELRSRNGKLEAELAETEKIQCDQKRTEKLKSQLTEIELDRAGLAHTVVELRSRIENLEGELAESKKIQCDEKLTSSKEIEKLKRLLENSEAKLSEKRSECNERRYEMQQHYDLLHRSEAKLRVILVRGDFAVVKDQIPIPSDQFLQDLVDLNEDPRDPVLNHILEIDSLVRIGTKLMIDVRVARGGPFMSIRDY